MALTYEQFRQKIASLSSRYAGVEALLRELFPPSGQVGWAVSGEPQSAVAGVTTVSVSANYTASAGEFVSVTCSTADIAVTLPSAVSSEGLSVWIHKVDGTQFAVTTAVKDVVFQNSTMRLVSTGVDWIVS